MANLVNEDRANAGVNPVALDSQLCALARKKSQDMLDNKYFAHRSPTYGNVTSMLKQFGVSFLGCSENISRHRTVYHSDAAFLSSEMHRRNLLSTSWTHFGVGVVKGVGCVYVTQIFVRR
ncbi:MAG: hypothetical protein GX558_05710 [Clostridiales bacterium]|nr:hypothetical protein [Clostridiales bacterium]